MKTSQIVVTSLSVLGAAGIGYAVYFDYRRRNDAAFRKNLLKDSKKTSKASKKEAAKRAKEEDAFIDELLADIRAPGVLPAGVEDREQYFLKYVTIGEQLVAMGAEHQLEASGAFFRALKVYPQPVELIMIFQKAVSKEVFDTIMRIVSKDIATGGDGDDVGGLDEVDEDGPSGLSEIVDDAKDPKEEEIESASTGPRSSHSDKVDQQQGTDSGTTSSQEWDTLSATSLTDTGVVVTPTNAQSNEEIKEEALSDSVTTESGKDSASEVTTSDFTPAPVFAAPAKE